MTLNELAELLEELEEILLRLKAMKDPMRRRLLLRKMSRLLSKIDRLSRQVLLNVPGHSCLAESHIPRTYREVAVSSWHHLHAVVEPVASDL
jgi:hypothetical protein